jgi:hypothetical protein
MTQMSTLSVFFAEYAVVVTAGRKLVARRALS